MNVCAEWIRALCESMDYSQMIFAQIFDLGQSDIVRCEKGEAPPPLELLVRMADRFDVSFDHIFGRSDNQQGKLYEHKPKNGYPADMANLPIRQEHSRAWLPASILLPRRLNTHYNEMRRGRRCP